jgi:hypothetical protein
MTITEGGREGDKGKVLHGIYELGKGTLKWCTSEPGGTERPKEFATKEGINHMLVTLKKDSPRTMPTAAVVLLGWVSTLKGMTALRAGRDGCSPANEQVLYRQAKQGNVHGRTPMPRAMRCRRQAATQSPAAPKSRPDQRVS